MAKWIKIPIEVLCPHFEENPVGFVEMKITVDDPEVPSYIAVCPKCGKSVHIAFGHFIHEPTEDSDVANHLKQGLQKKMEEIGEERSKYRRGSLYETFLAGVEQGIFYALNYPYASITMGDVVWKSREKDKKKENEVSKEKSG